MLSFRSEFYNITNHPNFNQPNFGGNGVVAVGNSGDYTSPTFGAIGSTRGAPYATPADPVLSEDLLLRAM